MYKKISLLVAITLATVLGVGCGQGESSVAGKSNKFSDDLEVKEKRAKAIELLIAKCTECGIAEEKARKYQPMFETALNWYAEEIVQNIYKIYPTKEVVQRSAREDRAKGVKELAGAFRERMCSLRPTTNINNRQGLMAVCGVTDYGTETCAKFTLILDDLGISDSNIRGIMGMFLRGKFMDEFSNACADFVVARIIKG